MGERSTSCLKICHLVRLSVYAFTGRRESLGPGREQAGMVGPLAMWLEASRVPLLGLSFPICLRASLLSTEMKAQLRVSHGLTEDGGAFEKGYLRTLSQVGQS